MRWSRASGRVDEMRLDVMRPKPAREPEAFAASLESCGDAFDLAACSEDLVLPPLQQLQDGNQSRGPRVPHQPIADPTPGELFALSSAPICSRSKGR
jgi:hypothetical protein